MQLTTIVGARPQFVKAAAVSSALAALPGRPVNERLVHTGQHYDASMSDVFFEELGIPVPSVHLGVGSGLHGAQTGEMLTLLELALLDRPPDAVMVYGDTNSTLAGALAASKLDLPLIHVESGLRSGVRAMPEEVNRVVTDHVSTMLLCPCVRAVDQLRSEGITESVHDVGDVMLDVLVHNRSKATAAADTLARLGIPEAGPRSVVTVHRPSNTDDTERFSSITKELEALAGSGWQVIWPVHPRVRPLIEEYDAPAGLHLIEPLSYLELLGLLDTADVAITDSGGVQREAYWLGVPCVTLRDETEWPETIESGFNLLWPGPGVPLSESVEQVVRSRTRLGDPPPVYGSGAAAGEIANLIAAGVN